MGRPILIYNFSVYLYKFSRAADILLSGIYLRLNLLTIPAPLE